MTRALTQGWLARWWPAHEVIVGGGVAIELSRMLVVVVVVLLACAVWVQLLAAAARAWCGVA